MATRRFGSTLPASDSCTGWLLRWLPTRMLMRSARSTIAAGFGIAPRPPTLRRLRIRRTYGAVIAGSDSGKPKRAAKGIDSVTPTPTDGMVDGFAGCAHANDPGCGCARSGNTTLCIYCGIFHLGRRAVHPERYATVGVAVVSRYPYRHHLKS